MFDYAKSSNIFLYDDTSNKYYDCESMNILGYNYPPIEDYFCNLNQNLFSPHKTDIKKRFESLWNKIKPENITQTFLYNDTMLASENALRFAIYSKKEQLDARGLRDVGQKIIHFTDSSHNSFGLTFNCSTEVPAYLQKLIPRWPVVSSPFENEESEKEALKKVEYIFKTNPISIAAVIIEPIQIKTGRVFRERFLSALKNLCQKYKAMLIFDESNFCLGTTGTLFIFESQKVSPDIVIFGDHLGLAGLLLFEKGAGFEFNPNENEIGYHKLFAYLSIFQKENLLKTSNSLSGYFRTQLELLSNRKSQLRSLGGKGLYISLNLQKKAPISLKKIFNKNGVLARFTNNSAHLFIPLTISKDILDDLALVIENCLDEI